MNGNGFGRTFIIILIVVVVAGFLLDFFDVINLPLGALPEELRINTPWFSIELPFGVSLLIGILLIILVDQVIRLSKK